MTTPPPEYIEAKSILTPLKGGQDLFFGIQYNMNLYRGCQHQCIYCDSRSSVYKLGNLAHIRIKRNAINLLKRKLTSLKKKGTIGTGSMNDPYMPIEKKEELTRNALKVIAQHKFPIHIITKSNLVCRDTDLLKDISNTYAATSFTITCNSDILSSKVEPAAPVTTERIAAMNKLSKAGIYTGAIISPVLPFISDTEENIKGIIEKVIDAGGKYVLAWMGMTQREGQREYFYSKLDRNFPGLRKKYHQTYQMNYECPVPDEKILYNMYREVCDVKNIATDMVFYNPNTPTQHSLF